MGTPCSRSPSPFPDTVYSNVCDYCHRPANSREKCPLGFLRCGCFLCDLCKSVSFCPICFLKLNNPVHFQLSFSCDENSTTKIIDGPFFKLELIFFAGFLLKVTLLHSDRNARLVLAWAGNTHTLLLYRNRLPYDIAPPICHRTPGKELVLKLIPTTVRAPKFDGSYCSWRLYHEMFPSTLDRPETTFVEAMPDTEQDLLKEIFSTPHKDERIWAVKTQFQKYDVLYFSSIGRCLNCLWCGRSFTSPTALAQSCLGFPYILHQADLESAYPVSILIDDGVFRAKVIDNMGNFLQYWKTTPPSEKRAPLHYSAIYDLTLPPTNISSVVRYLNRLLNSDGVRIPVYIIYAIRVDNDYNDSAIGAKVWLCRPITENLPQGLVLDSLLDKFQSLLYQGLFRTIVKEATPISSVFGSFYHWRDDFQAASLKSAAKTAT